MDLQDQDYQYGEESVEDAYDADTESLGETSEESFDEEEEQKKPLFMVIVGEPPLFCYRLPVNTDYSDEDLAAALSSTLHEVHINKRHNFVRAPWAPTQLGLVQPHIRPSWIKRAGGQPPGTPPPTRRSSRTATAKETVSVEQRQAQRQKKYEEKYGVGIGSERFKVIRFETQETYNTVCRRISQGEPIDEFLGGQNAPEIVVQETDTGAEVRDVDSAQ